MMCICACGEQALSLMLRCFSQCADEVYSYVHRLLRANQHPMYVRRRVLPSSLHAIVQRVVEPTTKARLYICRTQQLIVTAETN